MSAVLRAVPPRDAPRHCLDLRDLSAVELRRIVDLGAALKRQVRASGETRHPQAPLAGRTLGLILSKPSTRTRLSFEVGMRQLGGDVSLLAPAEMQLGRGESVADTARVLSRFLDVIVLRTGDDAILREFARWCDVPVINGLTPRSHPVQILADVMTFEEHRGPIRGARLAWAGDGNNVAVSLIEGAARFGYALSLATPKALAPPEEVVAWARREGAEITLTEDPEAAVRGADCVLTDTWVSMSDAASAERLRLLAPYQVDARLMSRAGKDAVFMHCLPAHVGEEVSKDVFEGPASVVFDEAENRLHAQKGLLLWALRRDGV